MTLPGALPPIFSTIMSRLNALDILVAKTLGLGIQAAIQETSEAIWIRSYQAIERFMQALPQYFHVDVFGKKDILWMLR